MYARVCPCVCVRVTQQGWVDSSPAVDDEAGLVFFATSNGDGFQNYAALYAINGTTGEVQHDTTRALQQAA